MKKFFYLLLVIAFLFSFTVCATANSKSTQTIQIISTVAEQFEEIVDSLANMNEDSSSESEELNQSNSYITAVSQSTTLLRIK